MNLFTKQSHRCRKQTDVERNGYQGGRGKGGIVREFGIDMNTLL